MLVIPRYRESEIAIASELEMRTYKPRVLITQEILQKIRCFIQLMSYEVNGFGVVTREGNDFVITDVFLIDQYTYDNQSAVKTDSRALARYITEMVRQGRDPSVIRLQWHSHVWAPAFFSSTDLETIGRYANTTDYIISLVMNKLDEYACRIDVFKPLRIAIQVPFTLSLPIFDSNLVAECQAAIDRYVVVVPTPTVDPGASVMKVCDYIDEAVNHFGD